MIKKKPDPFVYWNPASFFFISIACLFIILFLSISISFSIDPPKPPPPDADKLFQEAEKASQSKEQDAIRLYKEGLAIKPDAWKAREALGRLYEKTGRLSDAIGEYQRYWGATKTKNACILFSKALSKADFRFDAASVAEEGAGKYPSDPELQLMAGEMFININNTKKAIPYLQSASKLISGNANTLYLLGRAHELEGSTKEAFEYYSQSLKINPKEDRSIQGLKRLKGRAVKLGRLLFSPAAGWVYSGNDLRNDRSGQTIFVDIKKGKTIKETGEQLAAGLIPVSMYNRKPDVPEATLKALAEQASKEAKRNVTTEEIRSKLDTAGIPRHTMESETIGGPYKAVIAHASGTNNNEQFSRYVLSLTDDENIISFISDTGKPDPGTKDFLKSITAGLMTAEGGR